MKNYLKTGIILLGILLSTTNCYKDEFSDNSSQTTTDNKTEVQIAIESLTSQLTINAVQKQWIKNSSNAENVLFIYNFLLLNNFSSESEIIAIQSIDALNDGLFNSFDELLIVLEAEQNFKAQMSISELVLYNTLPISDKLNYLKSAIIAFNETERLFLTSCERTNGKGDAFRHAYWNALASQSIGLSTTQLLTNKHEEKPSEYLYNYKEHEMDLYNNQVGRNIFSQGSSDLKQDVLNALNNGSLRFLNNQTTDGDCRATILSQLIPTNK